MRWPLLALTVALAGCPADDSPDVDGGGEGHGLTVAWLTVPSPVPGPIDGELTLDSATLHLHNLRVIGDAGTGDPRTLMAQLDLQWATGIAPADVLFADAPTGLYSRLSFELDRGTGEWAYELTGTAMLPGGPEPFTLRDRDPLPVTLEYNLELPPGAGARIPVRVELGDIVRALELEEAPVIGGRRVIETGDPQAPQLRTEVAKAFGVHESDL